MTAVPLVLLTALLLGAVAATDDPSCGAVGPGSVQLHTLAVPQTDLYYVAVFRSATEASYPASGRRGASAEGLLLTLTTSAVPRVNVAGLRSATEYWFRWRSHDSAAPSTVAGWRNFSAPFSCTTGGTAAEALLQQPRAPSAPEPPVAGTRGGSRFMWIYRVSEYNDNVDFLPNHDSADLRGQAAFLTNTNSDMFFSFNTSSISRYCVEYAPSDDGGSGFAPYVSCNGPEGRPFGNIPESPICMCDVHYDRMIAHEKASTLAQACPSPYNYSSGTGGCVCGTGWPNGNRTTVASARFIGHDPLYLPYYPTCCAAGGDCDSDHHPGSGTGSSCWDPDTQIRFGGG